MHVAGTSRRLDPAAGLALFRVAQEALTNARKHAPGALVSIDLCFDRGTTVLEVVNGLPPDGGGGSGWLGATGGGFGLQGMRERIELLGGDLRAGPSETGWSVRAAVPA